MVGGETTTLSLPTAFSRLGRTALRQRRVVDHRRRVLAVLELERAAVRLGDAVEDLAHPPLDGRAGRLAVGAHGALEVNLAGDDVEALAGAEDADCDHARLERRRACASGWSAAPAPPARPSRSGRRPDAGTRRATACRGSWRRSGPPPRRRDPTSSRPCPPGPGCRRQDRRRHGGRRSPPASSARGPPALSISQRAGLLARRRALLGGLEDEDHRARELAAHLCQRLGDAEPTVVWMSCPQA